MIIEKMVETAVKALDSKKAVDIKVIKIDDLTTLADYVNLSWKRQGSSFFTVRVRIPETGYFLIIRI